MTPFQPGRLRWLTALLGVGLGWVVAGMIARAAVAVAFEAPFERYRQELEITFRSEAEAQAATFAVTPLWDGREWAVSGRWDDLNPNNFVMRDVLIRHDQRATFYLNGWLAAWDPTAAPPNRADLRELLRGGHSLGAHSLTHPWLAHCHRHRVFEEIAGIRMLLEATVDTPVVSFAFPYESFTSAEEGLAVQADMARLLERAGFYHVPNEPEFEALPTDLMLSPILPADGLPLAATAEARLHDAEFQRLHPILTYAMHVVFQTPDEWRGYESELDRYGHRPNWWYCNQNEFAAYRYQYRDTQLVPMLSTGRTRRLAIDRPVLVDLNDPIPLTVAVSGVPRDAVTDIRGIGMDVTISTNATGPFRFDVAHDRDQAVPVVFGMVPPNGTDQDVPSAADEDPDLPGLRARLALRDGRLWWRLENRSALPLSQARVTYRVPLAWTPGIARHSLSDLAPAGTVEDSLTLLPGVDGYKARAGQAFFVAQLDGRWGGRPFRLYAACHAPPPPADPAFPQGHFWRLGPIPPDQVDLEAMLRDLGSGALGTGIWRLDDGTELEWTALDGAVLPPYLDPERVRLTGNWPSGELVSYFVLRTSVVVPGERLGRLQFSPGQVTRMLLNGQTLDPTSDLRFAAGTNDWVVLATTGTDVFLRLGPQPTDGLRFVLPAAPTSPVDPYDVPLSPSTEPLELWFTRLADGSLRLDWYTSAVLQRALVIDGPWTDVATVKRTHLAAADSAVQLFRLRLKRGGVALP